MAPLLSRSLPKMLGAGSSSYALRSRDESPIYPASVMLIDRPEGLFDPGSEPFAVISSEDLGIVHSKCVLLQIFGSRTVHRTEAIFFAVVAAEF